MQAVPTQAQLIHSRFEQLAAAQPKATALVYEDKSLSYLDLNKRANRLAHYLRQCGVGPESRIALCADRSLEMIVGLLAILKAGGAYVPIDPTYPADRLAFMLEDSAPQMILTYGSGRDALAAGSRTGAAMAPVVDIQRDAIRWSDANADNPDPRDAGLAAHNLAYVIYTSGSTGKPKGVMVEHRNVTRLFGSTESLFGFGPGDVWTMLHSFAFDFSVWEVWGALSYGGRLIVVPRHIARSIDSFYHLVVSEQVTVLNMTPSAFASFSNVQEQEPRPHALRQVVFGGEALQPATLAPWYARAVNQATQLVNMYGITETTVHVTYRALSPLDAGATGSPIGQRLADLKLYLLDPAMEPVPPGTVGEIYVGGAGVARGYLHRPELTAERFMPNPFVPQERLYRSGDLARRLPSGELDFLGRADQQVKIRGFRIELGEIEARLRELPGMREVAVLAREDVPGERRLVAYYVARDDCDFSVASLIEALTTQLPEYMVPAAYMRLDAMPLTSNGKLDRAALPAPDNDAYLSRTYVAPEGELEQALALLWAELLSVDRVGRLDNFFELGGHSLLAVRMINRVQKELRIQAQLATIFQDATLAGFAENLVALVMAASRSPQELEQALRAPHGASA
ncbi:amino acid adenylation domain-containing protein [Rugamonas sp. A1-17]|nr:amino acid adenylation domain-containing protein [Rugamonas sp. A1-17]